METTTRDAHLPKIAPSRRMGPGLRRGDGRLFVRGTGPGKAPADAQQERVADLATGLQLLFAVALGPGRIMLLSSRRMPGSRTTGRCHGNDNSRRASP